MNFNNIIAIVKSVILKNYVNFEGRATRPEFWWFFLFNVIVSLILNLFGPKVGTTLSGIWSLAILLPYLGLSVRRLHDINKSGWYLLVGLIPIVGWILLIYWWAQPGDATDNQYGPVPQTPTADTVA